MRWLSDFSSSWFNCLDFVILVHSLSLPLFGLYMQSLLPLPRIDKFVRIPSVDAHIFCFMNILCMLIFPNKIDENRIDNENHNHFFTASMVTHQTNSYRNWSFWEFYEWIDELSLWNRIHLMPLFTCKCNKSIQNRRFSWAVIKRAKLPRGRSITKDAGYMGPRKKGSKEMIHSRFMEHQQYWQ